MQVPQILHSLAVFSPPFMELYCIPALVNIVISSHGLLFLHRKEDRINVQQTLLLLLILPPTSLIPGLLPSSAFPCCPPAFGCAVHRQRWKAGSLPRTLCLTPSLAPSTICKLRAPADHRCYKLPLSNPPSNTAPIKFPYRPPSAVVKDFPVRASSCQPFPWLQWQKQHATLQAKALVRAGLLQTCCARHHFSIHKW